MNYRLDVSYDGTKYKGWQRLKDTNNTIQGKIEEILSKYFDTDIKITASSRTDAGAHALTQVINFKIDKKLDLNEFRQEINHYLPADIIVKNVLNVNDRFHSRFNAVKKMYSYKIWKVDAKHPPLFERKYVYSYDKVLDVNLMERASKKLLGQHDFKGFSSDKTKKATIRNIESIKIIEHDFIIEIKIVGDGFLYNMVRIIAGTLLEIGSGDKDISIIDKVFDTNKREFAGVTTPACGLRLDRVYY